MEVGRRMGSNGRLVLVATVRQEFELATAILKMVLFGRFSLSGLYAPSRM